MSETFSNIPSSQMASHDNASLLAEQLGSQLKARRLKVTTAESCTGGGVASAITSCAGSSEWFEFGFVTYANRAKQQLLQVPESLLDDYGAVSEEVVKVMAAGALTQSDADLAVAVSGIAGPDGGSAAKPVGTVWFCWQRTGAAAVTAKHVFGGDREAVRRAAVETGLRGLLDILQN